MNNKKLKYNQFLDKISFEELSDLNVDFFESAKIIRPFRSLFGK